MGDRGHDAPEPVVHAAGGVVWRRSADGGVEVLLVHRPRYDDWSHPKGKRDPGETDLECAVREVLEETGLPVEPGAELATVRYRDHRDRPKQVRYWLMEARGDSDFVPNDEVDEVRWLAPRPAAELLTHDHDRVLLDAVAPLAPPPG